MGINNAIILKQQELYEKVWSTPMNKLCKLYNLSGNGLRKICKKMNIPTTPTGYWSNLRFKKDGTISPLPVADANTVMEYKIDPEKGKFVIKKPINLLEIEVGNNFRNAHPIIKNALHN